MIVYALIDPRTDQVRYVGKTIRTAHRRLRRHLAESYLTADTHKDRWLRQLLASQLEPRIAVLQRCTSLLELAQAERSHIAAMRAVGVHLTNLTDGGDGMGGWKHSPESRRKISAALKGKSKSEEHVSRVAMAHRGVKESAETRAKLSALRKGRGIYRAPMPGERNPRAKLTIAQVREIISLRGIESYQALANRFGVSKGAIRHIYAGQNWATVRVREYPEARK